MTGLTSSPSTKKILAASLVGTAIEFYDFYIYATAASLVFGPLFFPSSSSSAQLLSSYATFAIAFVARPVGALVFGHFGDRLGRKATLVSSLLLMGLSTTLIAFLPTYQMVGWIAPALLCLLRFGQGLGLGGEWGGAVLLAVENAPHGKRARFGMFPQLGAPVGFVAANGFFLLLGLFLTPQEFQDWGWRLPFLASALLVAVGLWIRLSLTETPAFAKILAETAPARIPLGDLMVSHWREVAGGTFGVVACFVVYYVATAFALGFGTTELGYSREAFLSVQLVAILFMAAGIICAGYLSDIWDSRRVLMAGCLIAAPTGFLLAPLMGGSSLISIGIFLSLALLAMGFVYGPLGAWLPSLFPARVRYSGSSVAFNVGGVLGGGLTPLIAQVLADRGGLVSVGYYFSVAAVVSLIALALSRKTYEIDE